MILELVLDRDDKKAYESHIDWKRNCVWRDDKFTQNLRIKQAGSVHEADQLALLMIKQYGKINHLINHLIREDLRFVKNLRAKMFY